MADQDLLARSVFDIDLAIYRLTAIKKAAYRFSAQYDVQIQQVSESHIRVTLTQRSNIVVGGSHAPDDFLNELLDQELRETVAEETKGVRDLLLAQTFSELSLVDPIGETADFHDDPLEIAKPPRLNDPAAANLDPR